MDASKNNNPVKQQLFDLDLSANIYTATRMKKWNQVFRTSVVLKQDVQPEILSQAISDLRDRFPTLYVQLKTGFFRYKLRPAQNEDFLELEKDYPCRRMHIGSGQKPMFRVLYFQKRISVEFFHLVTDGSGSIVYLKTLLARYFELQGRQIAKTHGVFDIHDEPKESETEDSFRRIFNYKEEKISRGEPSAYQYRPETKQNYLKIVSGLMSVDQVKQITKPTGATITQYLVAAYMYAFYQNMLPNKSKKPIKISVPANLRSLFGSETLRNFSLFANIGIDPQSRDYTFEEILSEIVPKIKKDLSKEALGRVASANASDSNLLIFRLAPLPLKRLILKIGAVLYGTRLMTSSQTNLGIVTVPQEMEEHIDHFEIMIGEIIKNAINCATITYQDVLNVTFTSTSALTDIQRFFFTFLSEQGIHISIQTNV
ncbi:MAG TPA: hypothetical protein VFD23_05720 [Clostridia bacterium]|nr:hypothetical protein [Clostridia bacterium]